MLDVSHYCSERSLIPVLEIFGALLEERENARGLSLNDGDPSNIFEGKREC